MTEVIVTLLILGFSARIIYVSVKKKANGQCDCDSCSTHCPNFKK